MHDATKIKMGGSKTSFRDVDNGPGTFAAGLRLCQKSDGTMSVAIADGGTLGISMGLSLSGTARTSRVRSGTGVPVLLTAAFTPVLGAPVHISDTTGRAIAAGAGATLQNAIYSSGPLTAVLEDGSEVAAGAAYIDFPGGL